MNQSTQRTKCQCFGVLGTWWFLGASPWRLDDASALADEFFVRHGKARREASQKYGMLTSMTKNLS